MFDFYVGHVSKEIVVVNLFGDLDDNSQDYFFGCVQELLSDGYRQIVIDCQGLGFISSRSLGRLIASRQKASTRQGKIYLTHLNSTLADLMSVTRLNSLFGIFRSTTALLRKLRRAELSNIDEQYDHESRLYESANLAYDQDNQDNYISM